MTPEAPQKGTPTPAAWRPWAAPLLVALALVSAAWTFKVWREGQAEWERAQDFGARGLDPTPELTFAAQQPLPGAEGARRGREELQGAGASQPLEAAARGSAWPGPGWGWRLVGGLALAGWWAAAALWIARGYDAQGAPTPWRWRAAGACAGCLALWLWVVGSA